MPGCLLPCLPIKVIFVPIEKSHGQCVSEVYKNRPAIIVPTIVAPALRFIGR